nr:MAG TPA: pentapeptide repeat protein [Caudoviricetes sp.]
MREITQEEINAKVKAHELWLDTVGGQGERAIFRNVLIKDKKIVYRNLRFATFESVELVYTDFERVNLDNAEFKNVHSRHAEFGNASLSYAKFKQCNITYTAYRFANLNSAAFINTILTKVYFTCSNLRYTNFSTTKLKNIFVVETVPTHIIGQKVICTQVNTSRENNLISYWADLGIWTTGCFQGTLEELREAVAKTHKDNPFLRARYERAINYILEEDKADKENGKERGEC